MIIGNPGDGIHREGKEDWLVSPARNLQPDVFALSLPPVVILEAVAKLTGVIANDIVRAAIVAFGSTEDVDANMMFRQRVSAPGKGAFADIAQKT